MFKKTVLLAIIFLWSVASGSFASTPQPPAIPRDYVTDLAGVITSGVRSQLNASLQELERKTTSQVLVLTVQSLDNQSIEEFSFTTKEKWKLGQKGKDNGVLIVVAVKDKKYRIEVGYGLESVLPDSLVGTVGREYLVPYFRKGDYSTGIAAAAAAIIQTIAHHAGVQITGMSGIQRRQTSNRQEFTLRDILMMLFLFGPIIAGLMSVLFARPGRHRSGRGPWGGGGYYGGFGGSSGGFGGFDGGSFGGGGGGSGGGGGASGSW